MKWLISFVISIAAVIGGYVDRRAIAVSRAAVEIHSVHGRFRQVNPDRLAFRQFATENFAFAAIAVRRDDMIAQHIGAARNQRHAFGFEIAKPGVMRIALGKIHPTEPIHGGK